MSKSQVPTDEGDWQVVTRKGKNQEKKGEKGEGPCARSTGTVTEPRLERSTTPDRSGDAIKVSAKDSQSYADISRDIKAKVDPQRAGLTVLFIQRTSKEEGLSRPQK